MLLGKTAVEAHPHVSARTDGPTGGRSGHAVARPNQWLSGQRNSNACGSAECSESLDSFVRSLLCRNMY